MSPRIFISAIAGAALVASPVVYLSNATAQNRPQQEAQGLSIPSSVVAEHKELHEELQRIIKHGGRTGSAADQVEKLLRPHFVKEESFALPPLGALRLVAAGTTPENAKDTIKLADRLKAELPEMLREHKAIGMALQRLRDAAVEERKQEAIAFADRLIAHATEEEQILYPAAILVGEYLKVKRK